MPDPPEPELGPQGVSNHTSRSVTVEEGLLPEQEQQLRQLAEAFQSVFSGQLGHTHMKQQHIGTEPEKMIWENPHWENYQ